MINRSDNREIVVVGAWNIAIFTQEWMQRYILQAAQSIIVQAPIGLGASLRFITEDYSFAIVGNRLEMVSKTHTSQSYERMIEALRKICRLLPHTPITAMGVNIGLIIESGDCSKNNNFIQADTSPINKHLGIVDAPQCNIERAFKLNDIETLNLTTRHNIEENRITFDFNYNYSVNNIESITSNIIQDRNDLITQKRQDSIALLNQVYGIE